MLIFFSPLLWAGADTELGVYSIEGSGDVRLRRQIEEKLYKGLLRTTSQQPYWIVSEKEQRRRLQNHEDELDCTEDCALPIAKMIGLDQVVTGTLETKKDVPDEVHYILSLTLHHLTEPTKTVSLRFDETQPLALQEKMGAAAQQLIYPKEQPVDTDPKQETALVPAEENTGESQNLDDEIPSKDAVAQLETVSPPLLDHLLSIESQPSGALVLVDGVLFCRETPCSESARQGEHVLSIQYEDHDAFVETITLQSDKSINAALTPQYAELNISGKKSASVFINGKKTKELPIFSKKIVEGNHLISLNDACYLREDHVIDAKRGEKYSVELKHVFRTAPIEIKVQDSFSTDYEATLLVDGKEVGTSPFLGAIPLCSKKLEVRLQRGEETLSKEENLTIHTKSNTVIVSVPDSLAGGKRSVPFDWSFLVDSPLWYGGIGFRDSTHTSTESARFQLSSGYIQPIAGGEGIYDYSLPANMFLDETQIGGLGLSLAVNSSHLFGRLDIDYGLSGALYYYAPEANGFPLMVYSPDIVNFSFSAGFMPMIPFFRPFIGGRVQAGAYTMDISEVDTNSEYLSSYPLNPYYLVATDYNEDGEPVRPKLQMGHASAGFTAGGLLYFPGNDFILGIEMQYSYMFSTAGSIQQVDTSLVFGNEF